MLKNVVSIPGSGRSWLRLVLGKIRCLQEGTSDKDIFQLDGYTFKHAYASRPGYHLYLLRDPRDLMVSSYQQYKYRPSKNSLGVGTFSDFIRGPVGMSKLVKSYNEWHFNWIEDSDSAVVFYEDMVDRPKESFEFILRCFEEEYTQEHLEEAIKFGEFENLKRLSARGYFTSGFLNAIDPEDEKTFKFRVGKVGNYKEHINPEDLQFIESQMKNLFWSRYNGGG